MMCARERARQFPQDAPRSVGCPVVTDLRSLGMSRVPRMTAWTLAVVTCSLAIAAPAQAKSHRVIGGHTTIAASSQIVRFIAFLRSQGIHVTAIAPAKLAKGSLTLPVVSGSMTTPGMNGVMATRGGLQFKKGNRILRVRDYTLSHKGGVATLSALVSGKRVSLRRIVVARMVAVHARVSGKTGTMTGGLKVTATWARLINQLVGKHVLSPGADLGDMSMKVKVA